MAQADKLDRLRAAASPKILRNTPPGPVHPNGIHIFGLATSKLHDNISVARS
jgi:hypothetical protein